MDALGNLDSTRSLRIEVEGTTRSVDYRNGLAQAVEFVVSALTAIATQMPTESRRQELHVQFGLKALASGGFAVGLDRAGANFTLSRSWRTDAQADVLGVMLPALGDDGSRV